jgi:hypothetical protein
MKKSLKAQAGLDFLMTYGWALLIIVLVIGALFALGIFDIGSFLGSRSVGFTQIGVAAWRINTTGALTMKLRNNAGTDVSITEITATLNTQNISYSANDTITNGKTSDTITVGSFAAAPKGSSYTLKVDISYVDVATGFQYADSGTLTGKVS